MSSSASTGGSREVPGLRRHRDFNLLWCGESISELGSQVSLLAIPLVAVRSLHATVFAVGVLTALSTVSFLLVGLPAGAWVDRMARRPVMIIADVGRLLVLASIPVAYGAGVLMLPQLYAVAFLTGLLTVFFDVAYQSYLPALVGVERIVEGNAKLAGTAQVAQIAGPSVAGGLVQGIGGALAVAVDAASYAISAMAVLSIRASEQRPARPGRTTLRREVGEGLRFVFGHPILRAIAATTATANLFGSMVSATEVVFLVRVVRVPPGVIGLLFAAGGVGGVLGALAASRIAARIGGVRATIVGILATSGAVLLPLTTRGAGTVLFAVGSFCLGFGSVLYNVNQVSFRQRLCPPGLLGRMNATMRFVVWGVLPVGALLGGSIASVIGVRPTLWVGTGASVLSVGWLLASPMRHLRDFPAM
ncbi:MAG: MFS transporter [Acidimicrobiales bacterium]